MKRGGVGGAKTLGATVIGAATGTWLIPKVAAAIAEAFKIVDIVEEGIKMKLPPK